MGAVKEAPKWRLTVTEVTKAPVEKVWAIFTDFGGLAKNFPKNFLTCEIIEGGDNKVGTVRASEVPMPTGDKIEVHEKLIHRDDEKHTLSYSVIKISLPFIKGYIGHCSAKTLEDGQTEMAWGFEMDPIPETPEDAFVPQYKGLFQFLLQTVNELATA